MENPLLAVTDCETNLDFVCSEFYHLFVFSGVSANLIDYSFFSVILSDYFGSRWSVRSIGFGYFPTAGASKCQIDISS